MFLARITFGTREGASAEPNALECVERYLQALRENGQIFGDYLSAWSGEKLVVFVYVERPNSLTRRNHCRRAIECLGTVIKHFGQAPNCEIIDDGLPQRFPSWRRSTSFYLFTSAFRDESPLRCGDTGKTIPLYLLPITQQTRMDLYSWARSYKFHDHIWLGSGTLEIPAYKQIADPASLLSCTGRDLCARVEAATNTATYYYLHRYWGRRDGEADRPCPVCGRKWQSSDNDSDQNSFQQFDFRCMRCRLVAHAADTYDDERHARIGEFRRAK